MTKTYAVDSAIMFLTNSAFRLMVFTGTTRQRVTSRLESLSKIITKIVHAKFI